MTNTDNGEVDKQTVFHYYQQGNDFYACYSGGSVKRGYMVGVVSHNGELDFYYQHLNTSDEIKVGKCHSVPQILEDGKIELHEEWQWLNGDNSKGKSIVKEL